MRRSGIGRLQLGRERAKRCRRRRAPPRSAPRSMKPRTTSRRYSCRVREATSATGMSAACSSRSAVTGPPRKNASTSPRRSGTGPMPPMASRTSSKPLLGRVELHQRRRGTPARSPASGDGRPSRSCRRSRAAHRIRWRRAARPSCSAVLPGPVMNSIERHLAPHDPAAAARRQLHPRLMGDQRRRAVGGRRGVDDVAADGGGLPDLVVGEPHRAARHGGQRRTSAGIVEETLDRRGGAQPHARAIDAALAQLGNFRRRRSAPGSRHRRRAPRAPRARYRWRRRRCDSARDARPSRRTPRRARPASDIRRRSALSDRFFSLSP